ncbi:MAG: hypothetical protein N2508_10065 [Anaerolineae bacterium]|nr:hypothetical protein [Anaerolineae bacterium]
MRTLIRHFDRLLRHVLGVVEFCDDPEGLLRVRMTAAAYEVHLPDRTVPAGAPVLELHLWNEHVPPLSPAGPDLAWAARSRRMLIASLRSLAHQMETEAWLSKVQAIEGVTVLVSLGGEGFFKRLGFMILPYRNPLGRFGEFWENLYTWMIMWTFNQASLRQRHLLHLRRNAIWMSREEFLRRYGSGSPLPHITVSSPDPHPLSSQVAT